MASFFTLARKHGLKLALTTFLGIAASNAVVYGGVLILFLILLMSIGGVASFENSLTPEALFGFGVIGVILLILAYLVIIAASYLVQSFTMGGIFGMGKEVLLENRSEIGTFFSQGFRYMWRLTGQYLLFCLCWAPLYFLMIIPFAIASELIGEWVVLFLLPFLAAFFFLVIALFLHAPAILVRDDLRVLESMKWTFRLFFSSSFGSVCLSTLLAGVAGLVVNVAFLLVAGLIVGFCILLQFLVHEGFVVLTMVAGIPLGLAYVVIVFPLSLAVACLLIQYRYERIRPKDLPQVA
ncbi:hypothetical protein JOD24_000097 [Kroppenstedtia sanguinis]|uniref:hypothetical protein n=1 Tax=Kroppenstedtia sanguinis TaxID=1380684 RepID=UPI003D217E24